MITERFGLEPPVPINNKISSVQPGKAKESKSEEPNAAFDKVLERSSSQAPKKAPDQNEAVKGVAAKQTPSVRKETKSEKSEELPENIPVYAQAPMNKRQKVMQEFMDSMESEFGIPPVRILEAMDQLSDKELLQSPEETASQIISKLDLAPEQAAQAELAYLSMLVQLQQVPDRPQFFDKDSYAPIAAATTAAAMKPNELLNPKLLNEKERRMVLNDSLDRLNQKFFMIGPDTSKTAEMSAEIMSLPKTEVPNEMSQPRMEDMQPIQPTNGLDIESLVDQKLAEDSSYKELVAKLAGLGIAAKSLEQPATKTDNLQSQQIDQSGMQTVQAPNMNEMDTQSQFDQQQGDFKENANQESKSSASNGQKISSEQFFAQPIPEPTQTLSRTGPVEAAGGILASPQAAPESKANIQSIMNQAQYMIRKGGGEAVVKMNPEGLGEVHLKVMVQDGKVNLEMATETKEAKKMLEGSLSDLKTSLHSKQLSLESIKVDVGNQTSTDLGQQKQSDFKFDQQKDQARQFMGQFREDNLHNRGQYFENPGLKTYQKRQAEPLTPSDEVKSSASRRYSSQGRGRGLDLVA